jgi:hypothetical protein
MAKASHMVNSKVKEVKKYLSHHDAKADQVAKLK